jgi:hypothetical protein
MDSMYNERPMAKRTPVQFEVPEDDLADLDALVGQFKSRAAVARVLFLYGLSHSDQAFAWYARPHQAARQKRLEGKP